MNKLQTFIPNPWEELKKHTKARIAIGRCGSSIPTKALLEFKLAHAKAIDAVNIPLDIQKLKNEIETVTHEDVICVSSFAQSRSDYLRRPDWGRKLSKSSSKVLQEATQKKDYDITIVVSDGLSATAIEKNILPFLKLLYPELNKKYQLAPIVIAEQARVALADEVALAFNSTVVINCIGERPGLKSPDSMGIYMTYNPYSGITDDKRNCISNIRKDGLSYEVACSKLLYLIQEAFSKRISGVNLKDNQNLDLKSGSNEMLE